MKRILVLRRSWHWQQGVVVHSASSECWQVDTPHQATQACHGRRRRGGWLAREQTRLLRRLCRKLAIPRLDLHGSEERQSPPPPQNRRRRRNLDWSCFAVIPRIAADPCTLQFSWRNPGWRNPGWRSAGWRSAGWRSAGWEFRRMLGLARLLARSGSFPQLPEEVQQPLRTNKPHYRSPENGCQLVWHHQLLQWTWQLGPHPSQDNPAPPPPLQAEPLQAEPASEEGGR
jgi:hypothetical protein